MLDSQAKELEHAAELHILTERRNAELKYRRALNELEIEKAKQNAEIEVAKISSLVKSITVRPFKNLFFLLSSSCKMLIRYLGFSHLFAAEGFGGHVCRGSQESGQAVGQPRNPVHLDHQRKIPHQSVQHREGAHRGTSPRLNQ